MSERKKVIIIGSGLTGSLLAVFLGKRGYQVDIYEKRSDIKQSSPDKKRTIAMSISHRGWKALQAVDLEQTLRTLATASYGRITHDAMGNSYTQHYGNDDEAIYTIDRKILNTTLIDCATAFPYCHVHFDSNLQQIDFDAKIVQIQHADQISSYSYDYLFATDGVFSKARSEYENFLEIKAQLTQLPIGYKEFIIPYSVVKNLHWDQSFVHVWPTESANFVALPSNGKQAFMGNLFCTNEWVDFFTRTPLPNKAEIIEFLAPQFPLLINVLQQLPEACFEEPSANMYGTRSEYWNYQDSFLLLGDAIHGMAPFYAMGMNTCFEDCAIFEQQLQQQGDIGTVIATFQKYRKPDVDAMQDIAFQNFRNLSNSSDSSFDQEWRLDRLLSQYCPNHWASESALISFHELPVAQVKQRVAQQQQFISAQQLTYDSLVQKTSAEISELCQQIKTLFHPYKPTI